MEKHSINEKAIHRSVQNDRIKLLFLYFLFLHDNNHFHGHKIKFVKLLFNSLRDRRPRREPIPYIYDFSRYEKSSSMKRPTLKVIDFDSVVQNTKSSKSIILMSAFSNILLQSRSSEATNIGYRFSSRAVFGWILFELNSSCGDLGERVEVFCLL